MTDTKQTSKSLTPEQAVVLNMRTRYKWEGATNLFAQGKSAFSPNEIATLNIPPGARDRLRAESPVWNAPFLANGARVRVVMEKAGQFRVFPLGATQQELEYMAHLMLAAVDAGMSRSEANRIHVIKGVQLPVMWLNKLEPEEAHDGLYHETQKRMALQGVDNPQADTMKLDFETLIRSLYLAVDAQMESAGLDLMFALPGKAAQKYLSLIRSETGTRAARSGLLASQGRKVGAARRRKLLGQPVYTMLTDNEVGVSVAAYEANQYGPLVGISVDADLRMPSDEAITVLIGNMIDRGVLTGDYTVRAGIVYGAGGIPSASVMTTVAKLAAIAGHPEEWGAFHDKWLDEAMLRDPDVTEQELARVMGWPDLHVMADVDMTVVRVVARKDVLAAAPIG